MGRNKTRKQRFAHAGTLLNRLILKKPQDPPAHNSSLRKKLDKYREAALLRKQCRSCRGNKVFSQQELCEAIPLHNDIAELVLSFLEQFFSKKIGKTVLSCGACGGTGQ